MRLVNHHTTATGPLLEGVLSDWVSGDSPLSSCMSLVNLPSFRAVIVVYTPRRQVAGSLPDCHLAHHQKNLMIASTLKGSLPRCPARPGVSFSCVSCGVTGAGGIVGLLPVNLAHIVNTKSAQSKARD